MNQKTAGRVMGLYGRPVRPAPVFPTGGCPSTWAPPERLAEQVSKRGNEAKKQRENRLTEEECCQRIRHGHRGLDLELLGPRFSLALMHGERRRLQEIFVLYLSRSMHGLARN